ncbi:hypothetical protein CASFOL_032386 [Castilleja foliolosa]|uniref:Mediator of RNA polymerase II transcription subunit 7 n=1 Tax=Castilleja foliolosa TaxID=1961234 RepID=A0ABD3C1B1_9LAMI
MSRRSTTNGSTADSAPSPPPPIRGPYVLYGGATIRTDDVLPGLEEQGVCPLYPQLQGPNIEWPSQNARRVEEISLIFKNLHHLFNSLRPHQARATLDHNLELQIQRRKQAVEDIKRGEEKKHKGF